MIASLTTVISLIVGFLMGAGCAVALLLLILRLDFLSSKDTPSESTNAVGSVGFDTAFTDTDGSEENRMSMEQQFQNLMAWNGARPAKDVKQRGD